MPSGNNRLNPTNRLTDEIIFLGMVGSAVGMENVMEPTMGGVGLVTG